MNNLHYVSDVTFYSNNMKESILEHKSLPLWTPYYYSGRPLFAQPEYYFLDFNLILLLLTKNANIAMNLSVIIHLFLSGLGMFLLVYYLTENKKASFISALLFMFNGFVHTFVLPGNIMIIEGYSLIPFIFLFTIKALKEKEIVLNSIIAGLFVAALIFVGGVIFIPYIILLIMAYSLLFLVDKNIGGRLLKLLIAGLIIGAVAFSVSAIKLLPGMEFIELSNRGAGLPYQEYLGEPIKAKNFDFAFISNVLFNGEHIVAALGLAGFLLLLFGLLKFRNRMVLFSLIVIMLSILISSETFLTRFLFKVPVFNQTRHIERSIVMFAFAGSILAAFGFMTLFNLIKGKNEKIKENYLLILISLLVLLELFMLQPGPESIDTLKPEEIPILAYMAKDNEHFRTMNLALENLVGATGYNYYSQLGIGELKGGSGIWFNDYMNFLIASRYSPPKFFGTLNAKYIVNNKNESFEGLTYIGEFQKCTRRCEISEAFGPYLYRNDFFMPRYYIVPNSVLVLGSQEDAANFIYGMMIEAWNHNNTVIVSGSNVDDYDISALADFDYILLLKDSVSQNSMPKLVEFKRTGGFVLPDVTEGKNSISNDDIKSAFDGMKGTYIKLTPSYYSGNKIRIDIKGEKGWLVASERFAYFPGWHAKLNRDSIDMFKANNAVTAAHLDGESGTLEFNYNPDSYKKGKILTIIASIIILAYIGYYFYRKHSKKSGDEHQA